MVFITVLQVTCIGFLRDILGQQALFKWWHGKGGLIDYTNKEALEWWHSQMDKVVANNSYHICTYHETFNAESFCVTQYSKISPFTNYHNLLLSVHM